MVIDTKMERQKIKCELYHDNFQNYKRYNIPKAQLVIADIPYNTGNNAYASNPMWYEGGDLFCNYYLNYGVTTNTSGLFQILKDNENKIEIRRDPAISGKTGKPTRFWSFGKGNKIYVRMK